MKKTTDSSPSHAVESRRKNEAEFLARAVRSLEEGRRTGDYVEADAVLRRLQNRLDAALARLPVARR